MQRLQHLHVQVVRERGVATDAEDPDRPLHDAELRHGLQCSAHRDRLAAAGTKVVRADVDQVRREVADERGRLLRRPVGRDDVATLVLGHRANTSSMRARMTWTSRSGAMPKPELSRLSPPTKCTGAAPRTARRTSSIICPWLFSYTATARASAQARATASPGNG